MEKEPIQYTPNMFFQCYIVDRLDFWEGFAEKMQELGFEMDCCKSFEEYRKNSQLQLKPAHSEREERKNILYLLEHADRQIVGNYLFSMWRYYTHWSNGWNHYDVDFLRRIVTILENKFEQKS